ncbi:MAG: C39 family peptidase [Bacteroides sp.]|nr:C39 family peptidase [Bacteroides sp.]
MAATLYLMKNMIIQQGAQKGVTTRWGEDDDYWDYDDDYWDLGGGWFYDEDTDNILYDWDEDGNPDSVWIPDVEVTDDDPWYDDYPDPDPDWGYNDYDDNYDDWDYDDYITGNNQTTPNNNHNNNQAKDHVAKSTDKMSKSNIPSTMPVQLANTCVTSIMEYMSKIFGNTTNEGTFILWYVQNYKINVLTSGVNSNHISAFVNQFFNTASMTSWKDAIDSGNLIMTNVPSNQANSTHNVVVIGYDASGNYIYMDPEEGKLQNAPNSHFTKTYQFNITGRK